MAFGDLLAFLRVLGHFLGVTQLFVARLFFVVQPLVFRFPACPQIWATVGQQRAESLSGGELFGVVEPGSGEQPGRVAAMVFPCGGIAFDVVSDLEVQTFFGQPADEGIPLAQQAFQGDFDDDLSVALIAHQQGAK